MITENKDGFDFRAVDHGAGVMDLRHLGKSVEFLPTEIHHRADGAVGDTPVFAFVLEHTKSPYAVVGQLSLQMLNRALGELGYKIEKT